MVVAERSDFFLWLKVREIFPSCNFLFFISILFGHCHVTSPYKEVTSLFGHCHATSTYMEPLFFGRFEQKVKYLVFQIHSFRKGLNNQIAAVMLQAISSLYTNCSRNSLFTSANTFKKYIVSNEYCIARHDDKMCFLPNCRYHNALIDGNKEILL